MNVSCYLNKEEMEFFKDYPKGWLKELVLKEMRTAAKGAEEAAQVDGLVVRTYVHPDGSTTTVLPEEVDEERAREHFPPEDPTIWNPPKDVFGPRLKR